jgi:hypothetical protein
MDDLICSDEVAALCRDWASLPGIVRHIQLNTKRHNGHYRRIFESGEMESIMEFMSTVS